MPSPLIARTLNHDVTIQPTLQRIAQAFWNQGARPWMKCLALASDHVDIPGTSKRDPMTPAYMRRDWSGRALCSGLDCVTGRTVTWDEGRGITPYQRMLCGWGREEAEERLYWKRILWKKEGDTPCPTQTT